MRIYDHRSTDPSRLYLGLYKQQSVSHSSIFELLILLNVDFNEEQDRQPCFKLTGVDNINNM
jgi:hypothetical protein